jgi:multiple sugar transport system permease protein
MKPKLSDLLSHAVLLLGAAIMLMPFVWMFFTAIKAPSEIFEASIWVSSCGTVWWCAPVF